MSRPSQNLQDVFLNAVMRQEIPVTVYLVNGYQMKGLVKGFDSFTVVLSDGTRQDLVYKHAISTITPLRAVVLLAQPEAQPEREDDRNL
ncbi:MAG: RNA chaperone Hfq [Clostridia bacterium]